MSIAFVIMMNVCACIVHFILFFIILRIQLPENLDDRHYATPELHPTMAWHALVPLSPYHS